MSVLIASVVVVLAVAAGLAVALPRLTTHRLQQRFGPEYDRTVRTHDGRTREAEQELVERLRLVRRLNLTPLPRRRVEETTARLGTLQELFVDDPARALDETSALLDAALDEIGYPTQGRAGALSVDHGARLPAYRSAQRVLERTRSEQVGTEELRTALLGVRDMIVEVVRAGAGRRPEGSTPPAPAAPSRRAQRPTVPRQAIR
ncbi:hypothetical protein OG455_30805 [Kitasatospora sp. NBC_01287]|uniref:hypothetical protein n=1 Tax=Kitasatospora sp. NBC_01287 TaxID=2903573 RepID=UPI00225098CF|nr:hypothetical protein [Kitasatospora sp. NBC_01287]MCX4749855.1 hypothetical protein [Kitasatospora sp. NBC_01287]